MSTPGDLDHAENWYGGFYELALNLGPRDDTRLDLALRSVWQAAAVEGCYTRVDGGHREVPCTLDQLETSHLVGTVSLPAGGVVVCGAVAIREDGGTDWLDFYLPLGALGDLDSRVGGFPFGDDGGAPSRAWREPVESWLAEVGAAVFTHVPFAYGIVGFEVSGMDLGQVATTDDRYVGVLLPADGVLGHLPVTRWDFGTPG